MGCWLAVEDMGPSINTSVHVPPAAMPSQRAEGGDPGEADLEAVAAEPGARPVPLMLSEIIVHAREDVAAQVAAARAEAAAAAGAPAAGASGAGGGRPKLLQGKPQPAAYAPPPPGFLGAVTAPIGKASARAASLQAARIKLAARLAAEARKERACVDLYRGAGRDDMMDQDGDGCYD